MAADENKARLEKIAKLAQIVIDLTAQLHDCQREILTLASGGEGQGLILKRLYVAFDTAWGQRYAAGQVNRYAWAMVRDTPQMKRLLKMFGEPELVRRMGAYVKSDDPFVVRNKHTFGLFVSTVNSYAPTAEPVTQVETEPPADCRHLPPCKSDEEHTKKKVKEMRTAPK